MTRPVPVERITRARQEFVLQPDVKERAALAARMGLVGIEALTCRVEIWLELGGRIAAKGTLNGTVVQEDVTTLDAFEAPLQSTFRWRFVPEDRLSDRLDPDDPEDEVGYAAGVLDLDEAMAQQLALVLDPYPRNEGKAMGSAPGPR